MGRNRLHAVSFVFSFLLLSTIIVVNVAQGQIPRIISYQGVALDNGVPLTDGDHTYVLTLYNAAAGGEQVYSQPGTVRIADGYFALMIGPIPSTLSFNTPYWLSISFDGGAESIPRTALTSSPYAMNAELARRSDTAAYAAGLTDDVTIVTSINSQSGPILLQGSGATKITVNGNTLVIHSDTAKGGGSSSGTGWGLNGNVGTVDGENFIGTLDNRPFEIHANEAGFVGDATSGRGRVFRFEATETSPNLLGGFNGNSRGMTTVGATISGGGAFSVENTISGNFGTIGGGKGNRVSGENGTISGGISNTAAGPSSTVGGGTSNNAESNSATIGGGLRNRAKDWNSTVSGGKDNFAEGLSATIGGGESNSATGLGVTLSGGIGNRVFGNYGTVGGGESNATSREHSTVGGGRYNDASAQGAVVAGGISDTASGNYAAVGGGLANRAKGLYATVVGGEVNHADGRAASVAGGSLNNAEGDYSTVIGGQGLTLKGANSFGFLANTPATDKKMTVSAAKVAVLGNVDLWLANNDTAARQIRFYAPNPVSGTFPSIGANYSSFQAGNQTSNVEYILPIQAGGVGDVLGVASVNGSKITLTWQGITSDRTRKENFLSIDPEGVLEGFRSLELGSWNYRGEGRRHYGVMAQDFNAAFGHDGLGSIGSDTTVQIVDLAGVAYLAIQGLEKRTTELKETQSALMEAIEELKKARKEQEELKARIEELEERVSR